MPSVNSGCFSLRIVNETLEFAVESIVGKDLVDNDAAEWIEDDEVEFF